MTNPTSNQRDNSATTAKVALRRFVLDHINPARVFDAFCGTGAMYDGAWKDAADYLGCDSRDWSIHDLQAPPRYWCDNRLALRCTDLHRFNIFDLDAYGDPWPQAMIIAARRSWQPKERGALVITDGNALKTRWGRPGGTLAGLLGVDRLAARSNPTTPTALSALLAGMAVDVVDFRAVETTSSARMVYCAVIFTGRSAAEPAHPQPEPLAPPGARTPPASPPGSSPAALTTRARPARARRS